METNEQRRLQLAQDLRAFADWLDETPEVILDSWGNSIYVSFYGAKKEDVLALARTPGRFKKDFSGNSFQLEKTIGQCTYVMSMPRDQICTSRVVGTRMVEKTDYEAQRALPKVMVEEEIIEWDCHPLLADQEEA